MKHGKEKRRLILGATFGYALYTDSSDTHTHIYTDEALEREQSVVWGGISPRAALFL